MAATSLVMCPALALHVSEGWPADWSAGRGACQPRPTGGDSVVRPGCVPDPHIIPAAAADRRGGRPIGVPGGVPANPVRREATQL